jgi:hypothetical protein
MIGCWSEDLIKASGPRAAPKGRMDGSSQDRFAKPSTKPLQGGRRPWMDPMEERLTMKG